MCTVIENLSVDNFFVSHSYKSFSGRSWGNEIANGAIKISILEVIVVSMVTVWPHRKVSGFLAKGKNPHVHRDVGAQLFFTINNSLPRSAESKVQENPEKGILDGVCIVSFSVTLLIWKCLHVIIIWPCSKQVILQCQ